jgi:hypothetical protein
MKEGTSREHIRMSGGGGVVINEASLDIDFRVESNGNTHMLFVDGGDNRVGINESSPTTQLQITGASGAGGTLSLKRPDTAVTAGQTLGGIEFITADSGSAGIAARILGEADGTGGEGKLVFATGTGGSTSTAWTITSGGDLLPGATDHGIHLGVTSAADSNLLDDYEEGTFTPALVSTGASFAYTHQKGFYTKIGNAVTFNIHIQLDGGGNSFSTNSVDITGLPFNSANVSGQLYRFFIASRLVDVSSSGSGVVASLGSNDTTMDIIEFGDNNTCGDIASNQLSSSSGQLFVTGTYYV